MKLCEILDLTPNPVKHPEVKLLNQYKNVNWGKKKGLETKDVVIRDKNTGTIYGRRTIVQRKT